jgi:hypothetical protein
MASGKMPLLLIESLKREAEVYVTGNKVSSKLQYAIITQLCSRHSKKARISRKLAVLPCRVKYLGCDIELVNGVRFVLHAIWRRRRQAWWPCVIAAMTGLLCTIRSQYEILQSIL